MIGSRLFRRFYAIITLAVVCFIVLGFVISETAMRLASRPDRLEQGPAGFLAQVIDELEPRDHAAGLRRVKALSGDDAPDQLSILDESGHDISSGGVEPQQWNGLPKPTRPFEFMPLHPGPPPGGGEGLVRLPGVPVQYLYSRDSHHRGPPFIFFLLTFSSLLLSVGVGVGCALWFLFRSIAEKMQIADGVISALQHGDLKARFEIRRRDEMAQPMIRFNRMAEEIERLVERLRTAEKSRNALLQELAHDLRTPIASLKNLMSTLEKVSGSGEASVRAELFGLAEREVEYFERLVEDLLVLAQVSEPRYQASQETVSLVELVAQEAESPGPTVVIDTLLSEREAKVAGDPHLLRRMLRNAIENARSFARSGVVVRVERSGGNELRVRVCDDGPGFSPEALGSFGERRVSRFVGGTSSGRISVGLGSVIMKAVAVAHHGRLQARNATDAGGAVVGAEVEISLPLAPLEVPE